MNFKAPFLSSGIARTIFIACTILAGYTSYAQVTPGGADRILAVVGRNRIILNSDLEVQFATLQQQDPQNVQDTMKCLLLQQMIVRKLLVEQAEHDSLLVSDDEVEGNIENKIRYYIRQFGSKEKLEEVAGKTIYQIKDENREVIKEQLMADKMQGKILENVKITPAEVTAFYNKQSRDSLPFYPATVEVGQIVVDPAVSPEMDDYARKRIADIRKEIVENGASFEAQAGLYSDDPGTRDEGGFIGDMTRNSGYVPEFVAAAFKLQNGEVSPIVKTQFGYHIIQMVQRKGDQVDVRHILIRPQRVSADFKNAMEKLDSVRSLLVAGTITFPEAVGKFSTDEMARQTGGMITDPATGAPEMEFDKLDPAMALMIDTLKPGAYSHPQTYVNERGDQSTRIIYLKTRTEPHKANLKDDYSKIQQVALSQKQAGKMEQWVREKIPTYYIRLDDEYKSCNQFGAWMIGTTAAK